MTSTKSNSDKMTVKTSRQKIDGWLVLDKPQGITSSAATQMVRRHFNVAKIGHGGTLDPEATGVLPLALGEATKTVPYLMDASKDYLFTLTWGTETTTDDIEGEVTTTSDKRPSREEILSLIPHFIGEIDQKPPKFSAIKVDGRRAYDLARRNQSVELQPRKITIHHLELLDHDEKQSVLKATTGKGAYIRALARDIARAAASAAHVSALRRLRVGPFDLKTAFSLDFPTEIGDNVAARRMLLPLEAALGDILAVPISDEQANGLRCGRQIDVSADADQLLILGVARNTPVALIRVSQGKGQPVKVFNLADATMIEGETHVDNQR